MSWLKIKGFLLRNWPLAGGLFLIILFFYPFLINGLLPVPADTIVGLYHPFRDIIWDGLTNGVPFKNFLITDPVRQLYPWRFLAASLLKTGELPLWNPYQFAGSPLLSNLQTAVFYPFNFFFLLLPFNLVWSFLIVLQSLLAFIFTFLFLRNLKLTSFAAVLGAVCFSFSSFFISWLEWGTVLHVALWLPLLLLAVDRFFVSRRRIIWTGVLAFGLCFSFFAGHLQTFFYSFLFILAYFVYRAWQNRKELKGKLFLFAGSLFVFFVVTLPQSLVTLGLILSSNRGLDQDYLHQEGWFLPFKHLVTLVAPDFFGNPTTLNYWGDWNYGELTVFIGTIPLFLALLATVFNRKKEVVFFGLGALVALSFALPTPWAKLPFFLNLPFISSAQPTRLIFLVVFCLSVLAAFGVEKLFENRKRFWLVFPIFLLFVCLWGLVILGPSLFTGSDWTTNLAISQRNLILPTGLMIVFVGLMAVSVVFRKLFEKNKFSRTILLVLLFGLICFDLFRFGRKFTPFVKESWLFPMTETIGFLKEQKSPFRIMSVDNRILPPNFATYYQLEDVSGYDPLYLKSYAQLVAAWQRGEPNIEPPFGFNRIITPTNFDSRIADLLNVKYILSLNELENEKLELVFEEGQTKTYLNTEVFERAFMVFNFLVVESEQEAIDFLFAEERDLKTMAVLQTDENLSDKDLACDGQLVGKVEILDHQPSLVVLETESDCPGLMVLTDSYYPFWDVFVDDKQEKVYRTNYNFRGVFLPAGEHRIEFKM